MLLYEVILRAVLCPANFIALALVGWIGTTGQKDVHMHARRYEIAIMQFANFKLQRHIK